MRLCRSVRPGVLQDSGTLLRAGDGEVEFGQYEQQNTGISLQ